MYSQSIVRNFLFIFVFLVFGCNSISYTQNYIWNGQMQNIRNDNGCFDIFDLEEEGRLMITECLGKSSVAIIANYATLGGVELGKNERLFYETTETYLKEKKSTKCNIKNFFKMDDVTDGSYEAIYNCL